MAHTIYLGTFSKHENSTAQPTYTGWASFDVTFKEGADISAPDITISADLSTVINYNYAVMLGRYYWIRNKNALRNGLVVMQLEIDVLATYKSEIGDSNLYILRSSAAYDGNIRDNYYPMTSDIDSGHHVQSTGVPGDFNTGVVVLNVSGTQTTAGTTLFQFTTSQFRVLIEELYTAIDGFQPSDVISGLAKLFGGNPQQLINGAMWFPFPFSVAAVTENVKIGAWTSSVSGGVINDPVISLADYTYTIFKHPQSVTRGEYLNLAPYSVYNLLIPGSGVVSLDTTKLIGESTITVKRAMDAFTGQLITRVIATGSSEVLAYCSGQIGIPITLKGDNNVAGIAGGALSTAGLAIGAAMMTNPATAIIGAVSAGIGTIADAVGGTPTSTYMGAGAAGIMLEPGCLDDIHYLVVPEDNTRNGRPLCQVKKPSALGGFMIAQKGDIDAAIPLPEHDRIRAFLETGFFYE